MKKPFFARYALLVLMVIFFLVPFALRGSRYAVQRMKNDVKDWLPSDFAETAELDWFRQRFLGEQFVVISWDGCHGTEDDEQFKTFVDKLFPEFPPSANRPTHHREDFMDDALGLYARSYVSESGTELEQFLGNKLSLRAEAEQFYDWGGRKEKWLRSGRDNWVYLTPNGELYQWLGNRTWPAQMWRAIRRATVGPQQVTGEFVASLGSDGDWYYQDPRRLNARLFKSITTGPSLLSEMTREDGQLRIEIDDARERLRGVFFGPDGKQTCIVVTLTEAGKQDPRALLGRGMLGKPRGTLLDIAEASGVQAPAAPSSLPAFLSRMLPTPVAKAGPMLRLGGPIVDNAAIDEEGQITLARLLGLSLLVGISLSWLSFRSVNVTIMVFLVGGISAIASVGLVHWAGSQLDAVLMSMPSLVYVLGISGAVHIVNYYRESISEVGIERAPDRAVKLGLWPCTMAAFTTSLGLLSLAMSNIVPIRKFGFFSAIGVAATLILLFTYLPAALAVWPPRRYMRLAEHGNDNSSAIERFFDRFWQNVGRWVICHYRLVAVTGLLSMVFIGYGLSYISTSIQLLKLFDKDAKIIQDYKWLESNLGKLVPMEVVIRVDPRLFDSPAPSTPTIVGDRTGHEVVEVDEQLRLHFLDRMEIARYASIEIDRVFGEQGLGYMANPVSAATFARIPDLSGPMSDRFRSGASDRLEASRNAYVDADFLRDDPTNGFELWRVSLRLAALSDIEFGEFVHQIKSVVEPMLAAYQFRQEIIEKVLVGRESRGAPTLCVVGFPNPIAERSQHNLALANNLVEIDQTSIFAGTLHRLLKSQFRLIQPTSGSPDTLRSSDAIVVLQDDPQFRMEDLLASGPPLVDARNHGFRPALDRTAMEQGHMVSAVYTGLVPVVYKAQRTLLTSLFQSTGWAFVMIAIVMILLLRSITAGLLSMLPNLFPVIAIFGFMGWCGIPVDIGSMMTASVAMGVAVDDTIHFLSWFRRGLDEGHGRPQAILLAYRRVATAMTQTTAIGGIGLSIFAFSTFTPTQQFGTLMLALLVTALIGDLLLLPALLASPLGRIFDRDRERSSLAMPSMAISPASVPGPVPHSAAGRPHIAQAEIRRQSDLRKDSPH